MKTLGIELISNNLPKGRIIVRFIKADDQFVYASSELTVPREQVFDLAAHGHDFADMYESYFNDNQWFKLNPEEIKNIKNIPKLNNWIIDKRNNKIDSILSK